MRCTRVSICVLTLCLLAASPAFAQKAGLKKAVQKVGQSAAKSSSKTSAQAAAQRAWKSAALKEAKQTDRLFNKIILKNNQAQLQQLVDVASFRMYNEEQGLLAGITDMWSTLLSGMHIAYFGPRTIEPVSSLQMRKQLLQSEARLNHALKKWNELKPIILKTANPAEHQLLARQHTATRFLFENSDELDLLGKEVALYAAGKKDALHIMAAGQPDIELLYRKLLAFAHGKGAFPFRTSEVYDILQLREYPSEALASLEENLNSLECDILRGWGWKDKDIRRVISLYRSKEWSKAYGEEIFSGLKLQHDFIEGWRKYWDNLRPKDLAATQQLMQELRSAR